MSETFVVCVCVFLSGFPGRFKMKGDILLCRACEQDIPNASKIRRQISTWRLTEFSKKS